METKAKYYVPEIEELRVGFECEIQSSYGFQKGIFPEVLYLDTLSGFRADEIGAIEAVKSSNIRVKYLDSEDIEELGGIKISDYKYNINGAILEINYSDSTQITISEIRQEWEMTAVPSKTAEYYFPLFMGKIKNKSELKQVLKMIGVQ